MRKAVSTPNTFGNLCSAAGKVTHIESWVFAEPKEHLSRLVEAAKPFWPTTWTCGYIVDTFHVRQASELQLERFAFFSLQSIWTRSRAGVCRSGLLWLAIWSQQVSSPFWCAFIIIYCDILVRTCSLLLGPDSLGIMCIIWYIGPSPGQKPQPPGQSRSTMKPIQIQRFVCKREKSHNCFMANLQATYVNRPNRQ